MRWLRAQWDRVIAWLAIAVGALALLLGWLGISRAGFPAEQIPYIISGGIFGIFLLGIGSVLWLSADLRDEWRKLEDLDRRLAQLAPESEGHEVPDGIPGSFPPEVELTTEQGAEPVRRHRRSRTLVRRANA